MIELKFKQTTPQMGEINIFLRIIGKLIYFKFNNSNYGDQIMKQLSERGAVIMKGNGWLSVNMFVGKEQVKIGDKEFNVQTTPKEEIEMILANFYTLQYLKAGFTKE